MAIYRLAVSRTQWAVGHGFFHSGSIGSGRTTLTYVYDCGAMPKHAAALQREIKTFRADAIDVMFVSHFDYDHVSGIPDLHQKAPIARFVLPMIPAPARFFELIGRHLDDLYDDDGDGLPPANDWYWQFLATPEEALTELTQQDATVDIIAPRTVVTLETESEIIPPEDLVGAEREFVLDLDGEPAELRASRQGQQLWEFFTYVLADATSQSSFFADELLRRGLITDHADLEDPQILARLVLQHGADLKRAYQAAVAQVGSSFTLNLTSLMLFNGPVASKRIRVYRSRGERLEMGAWPETAGWIGFGDASIAATKRRSEAIAAFDGYRSRTGVFAPPHHGSVREWDPSLLDGFGADRQTTPTCVFAASGGKHPSLESVLDVNSAGGTAIVVTADARARWTDSMTVFVEP